MPIRTEQKTFIIIIINNNILFLQLVPIMSCQIHPDLLWVMVALVTCKLHCQTSHNHLSAAKNSLHTTNEIIRLSYSMKDCSFCIAGDKVLNSLTLD